MKDKQEKKILICENKKVRNNYQIIDKYIAGLVLTGDEIKSIRNRQIHFENAYITELYNEVYILGMHISFYKKMFSFNSKKYNPIKKRKLLLKKDEIQSIFRKVRQKNCVIIPINIWIINNFAKVEIAISKHLKKFQIKSVKKEKDLQRRIKDIKDEE